MLYYYYYWSLEGSLQSFHPSAAMTSVMYVFEKMTVAEAPQARPSHTFPEPLMVQLMKAKPVSSLPVCLPWAVMDPLTPPPHTSSFAIDLMLQPYHTSTKPNKVFELIGILEMMMITYIVEGSSVAKDEINGSLDETFFEIMSSFVIIKCVLSAIKSTSIESSFISCNSKCHCLPSNTPWTWLRSCVLFN